MTLDLVIPTLNRSHWLRTAVESLFAADIPAGLQVTITVADNGSTDDTRQVVEEIAARAPVPVRYVFEPVRGHARPLNAGIATCTAELIGLIDDDEKVDPGWFRCVYEAFQDPGLDFIGGPYIPDWEASPPEWLPRQASGVISCFSLSPTPKRYGSELPGGSLASGNAVIRRSLLQRAGGYRTDLGSHHDMDMYLRLMKLGANGMYRPDLIIYHRIPADRLRKPYFRRWVWRAGLAYAVMQQFTGRMILGVPLYMIRRTLTLSATVATEWLLRRSSAGRRFEDQLDWISSVAYIYARLRLKMGEAELPELSPRQPAAPSLRQ